MLISFTPCAPLHGANECAALFSWLAPSWRKKGWSHTASAYLNKLRERRLGLVTYDKQQHCSLPLGVRGKKLEVNLCAGVMHSLDSQVHRTYVLM
jgi:hypothetical protein